MEKIIEILIEFGYVCIFGILGAITLLIKSTSSTEQGMESYKKARKTLGISLISLSAFSLIRLFSYNQPHSNYHDFWILVTFTLIVSWLTYASILFLIETPRYITRRFIIDGAIPTVLMIITGIIGDIYTSTQEVMSLILGGIFSIKCIYMVIICQREYKKCSEELDNYYDESPDIEWIKSLIWVSFIMSISTVASFYIKDILIVYYLMIPIIYAFIVFKIINFAPRKIDNIRRKNEFITSIEQIEQKVKVKDLSEKISPLIEKWVDEKNYCKADLNIKDVAMEMGTNHNYLSQYLNNYLDMTFQVWLNTLRIEESKQILVSDKRLSIEEVGNAVGIPQSYNFSRWFRIVTGTTPFKYRKNN